LAYGDSNSVTFSIAANVPFGGKALDAWSDAAMPHGPALLCKIND
jgi:hypothetical protein